MTAKSISKVCSVDGCSYSQNRIRRGLCDVHWKLQKSDGGFPTPEEHFWSRVNQAGDDECWEWTGSRSKSGYGSIRFRTRYVSTHILAWTLTNGREPLPGMYILHSCDNRPCCNPTHLREGSPRENTADMLQRDRYPVAENSPHRKLTISQVRWVRANHLTKTLKEMASALGVSASTVSDAIHKTWRSIE